MDRIRYEETVSERKKYKLGVDWYYMTGRIYWYARINPDRAIWITDEEGKALRLGYNDAKVRKN